jgi:hypothetical protein
MSNPMQIWNSWLALSSQAALLNVEAQGVMALRIMRLTAGGARGRSEAQLMVTEKIAALGEAQAVAASAALMGGDGHRAAKKVLDIYQKRVRGNQRRLTRS